MIPYRNRTLREIITEILIRAKHFRVAENIDWETCRLFVNHAVREVVTKTRAFKRWAYIRTIPVVDGALLPQDYIEFVRVAVHNGDLLHKEARYADVREFWTVTDVRAGNIWNIRTDMNPVFTIWGNIDPAPFTNPTPPDTRIWIRPNNYVGFMDAIMYPPELINDNDICQVPYDYEELVVYGALLRLLYKLNNLTVVQQLEQLFAAEYAKIAAAQAASSTTSKRELDSFVLPVQPIVPPPPVEGEAPQELR